MTLLRPRILSTLLLATVAWAPAMSQPAARGQGLDQTVSIRTRDTDLGGLLTALATRTGLNLIMAPEVTGKKVSLQVSDLPLRNVLRYLEGLYGVGIALTPDERTLLVGTREAIAALDIGRMQIMQLSHASAESHAALLNKIYQGKLQAFADARTNTVIVVPLR